jgi:hypothetical protein
MTITPSSFATRSFERSFGSLPSGTDGDGEFAALLATEGFQPKEATTTPPVLTDIQVQPDPGFTAIFDVPVDVPVDPDAATSGVSSGSAGANTAEDNNEPPPVVTDTGGQTNQLPEAKAKEANSVLRELGGETNQLPTVTGGETNYLPKPVAAETNQLQKTQNGETNYSPKAASPETAGLPRAQGVTQRAFDTHAVLSSNLRTLLELQESDRRQS